MTTSPTGRSVSRRVALAGLGAGGLGLTLARLRLGASAQEATPIPRDGHPVVGVWQENPDPANPGNTLPINVFAPTGAYVEYGVGFAIPGRDAVGIGAWRPTGERSAEVVVVDQSIIAVDPLLAPDQRPPANLLEGNALRLRKAIEIDESGSRFAGVLHVLDDAGNDIPSTRTAISGFRLTGAPTP